MSTRYEHIRDASLQQQKTAGLPRQFCVQVSRHLLDAVPVQNIDLRPEKLCRPACESFQVIFR